MRAEDRNLRTAAGGGSGGDEETASGAHVLGERILQKLGQRTEIGENDEGVIGGLTVGGLVHADRFENVSRLRGRGERGADVERRMVVAVVMDEQGLLRVGTFDGKVAKIVSGEGVGGIDLDLAAAEAVGRFERGELDVGASVGRDRDGLGGGGLAIHDERYRALRGRRAEAGDYGLHVNRFDVLAPDLPRGVHRFHCPVGLGLADHGMHDQLDVGGKGHVGEGGGQVRRVACR